MKVFIKNMVCNRCKIVVRSEFEQLGFTILSVELGEVEIASTLEERDRDNLKKRLEEFGFELIDDKKGRIIERIKTLIIKLVHENNGDLNINLSTFLTENLNHDYHYLSSLFSEVEGKTIEKFYIAQRIEKVKELLVYDELSLSEIAYRLNYSSVAYLSSQFKKVTGLTPSFFKQAKGIKRKPLDQV